MRNIGSSPLRRRAHPLRLDISVALGLSAAALAAMTTNVHAQQTPATPLPPVPIEPPAQALSKPAPTVQQKQASPQPKPASAPKQAAAAKPKPDPVPQVVEAPAAPPASPATALGTYNPALDLRGVTLPPGAVLTTAGPVQGYRALSATSSTKTATPIEQIPQSIQVIPKSLIDDQKAMSVTEVVQNVSNVQGLNPLGIGATYTSQSFVLRGFFADKWLDGMTVPYDAGYRDALSNIERIEVLKGPNAILYGGGYGAPVGGAVNVVSKLPTDVASAEVGVTVGSFNYFRTYFDVNQPITSNGTVLFRMTGEYTGTDSFIDVLNQKNYALHPTWTITNKTDTTLTVQLETSKMTGPAYPGLPAVGTITGDFRLSPSLYAGDPHIPNSYTKRDGITVSFDHSFDPIWSFSVKARYSKSFLDQNSQSAPSASPDVGPTTWSMLNVQLDQGQQEFSINPNLRAKFSVGDTKNTLLFGVDYSRVTDAGFMNTDYNVVPVDLTNPIFVTPYTAPNPSSPTFFSYYNFTGAYTTAGAYTQLQSTIADKVHLLGGLRLANLSVNYFENVPFGLGGLAPPEDFTLNATKVLPRAGIVVDITHGLSAFASYSEGMSWTSFTQAKSIAPEQSTSREAGFKFKLNEQLTGTVSAFNISRTNVPYVVGLGDTQTGAQQSHGYEADMIWQPTSQWKILGAYGYTSATFTNSGLGVTAGNLLPMVPASSGRLWAYYAFDEKLKGLSVGAGVYASTGQYVDSANMYKTPGYFTIDSKIGYEINHWTMSLDVKNLTGEKYYSPNPWFGGQVAPGAPREFFGTVAYKF